MSGFAWLSTARSRSARPFAQSRAMPPPRGSTNGDASTAPRSRVAARIRSVAPIHVSFTPAAAPSYVSDMPAASASSASFASSVPDVMDSRISFSVLPI